MGTTMWWILDLAVILIAVYVIVTNAKRGVTKSLILGIGYVITTLVASLLAAVAAPTLYQSVAYDNNITGIMTANNRMDFPKLFTAAIAAQDYGFEPSEIAVGDILRDQNKKDHFDTELYQYACQKTGGVVCTQADFTAVLRDAFISGYGTELNERLPRYVRMYFERKVRQDPETMRTLIGAYFDRKLSPEERADVLEKQFAAQPTVEVLQIFIYFILFSVIMVVVAIISAVMQNRLFFNIQKSSDHALGALIGVIEAGAMLVILTLLVRLILLLCGGSFMFIDDDTVSESALFSFFYNHLDILL